MVFECTFDELMKQVRREQLMYIRTREVAGERLVVKVRALASPYSQSAYRNVGIDAPSVP